MNNKKYLTIQKESKRVFKTYKSLLQVDVKGIRVAVVEGDDLNNIRHKFTNYEGLHPVITKEEMSEVAVQAIAKLKNYVNSLIWKEQQQLVKLLLNNVEALNTENKELISQNKELTSQLKELKSSFQGMLKYNAEITNELRVELGKALVTKELYVSFIADLCDCSFDDALHCV